MMTTGMICISAPDGIPDADGMICTSAPIPVISW